jgi:hypothetical protein
MSGWNILSRAGYSSLSQRGGGEFVEILSQGHGDAWLHLVKASEACIDQK